VRNLSRTINQKSEEIEETLSTLTKNGTDLGVDELIAQYDNNKEAILDALGDKDRFTFDETQGMTLADLKSYVGLFLDDTEKEVGTSFGDWLINYLENLYKETKLETDKYTQD